MIEESRHHHGNTTLLPKLPPLLGSSKSVPLDFRGPTPWSNYVIQGRVIAGAYPAVVQDDDTHRLLRSILKTGVNTFVCLQAEFNPVVSDIAWKSGKALRPYIKDAQKIIMNAKQARQSSQGNEDLLNIYQSKLDLLHLPIVDGSISSDQAMSDLADDCCQRVLNGERLYIHCWGGHWRTGTLVAIMLARLYNLDGLQALHYTQKMHDARVSHQNTSSPQTQSQVLQVLRILAQQGNDYSRKYTWPVAPLLPFTALEESTWKKKLEQQRMLDSSSAVTKQLLQKELSSRDDTLSSTLTSVEEASLIKSVR